ncbi:hypothetical protein FGO68_gene3311 [Halteria grandinella]|uniref:EF-hand domain-containing protein n=1 Tax=Halteria grandinella TaxID=5974 RepID=A0A8J8NCF0_HALGN|nr:hypothetical protein FGO68_gene3311 [Halteria grandinella]
MLSTSHQKQANPKNKSSHIDLAFRKYSSSRSFLTKLEFKCAFIFLTGMKSSKQDIKAIADYISSAQGKQTAEFIVEYPEFEKIMGLYMEQIGNNQGQSSVDEVWKQLNRGKTCQTMNIKEFSEVYDRVMPQIFDREVALEVFQELDADKDGKITFKDFKDAMQFEL